MLRNILGVIAGYIVLFLLIMITFTGLYLAIGKDGAFKPGVYEPSMQWTVAAFVLGTIATIAGGAVCALIARRKGAVIGLMVVVLVFGLLEVVLVLMAAAKTAEVRTGEVSNVDAMMKAVKPMWVTVVNPLLGMIGVWIGGKLVLKGARPAPVRVA